MSVLRIAAVQMACGDDTAVNVDHAEQQVRAAAALGARVILLQELFQTRYFCKDQDPACFDLARPARDNALIARFAALAAELEVVLPLSFFERAGQAHFNSLAMIDADGSVLGFYRKSHIPDGPGYQEKFYFSPGDTGFRVFVTRYGALGAAICWDQWFPEAARAMVLAGAEVLLYPTAIGSEPEDPDLDTRDHWRRAMQGHAAANLVPVVAANRVGREPGATCTLTFYGSSFITDHSGALVAEADRESETIIHADLDLVAMRAARTAWGVFRDRRPDLYRGLQSLDGAPTEGGS